jgi:hypothetical protein
MLRVMAALVVGSMLWATSMRAAETGEAAEIRAVIEAQLEAFQADDGAKAFGFASPAIQNLFGDPETFLEMVRRGYPAVYRPRQVEFQELTGGGDGMTQRVLLVGPDGVPVVAAYLMQRQPDGSWRINGCILERSPDQTA